MKNRKNGKIIIIPVIILLIIVGACIWYVNDYYHADEIVYSYMESTDTVNVTNADNLLFFDGPGEADAMIFYPGAKVEYTAYAPLFCRLAEQGVDCFVVEMPCNLAILGMNKAGGIMETYEYENWYVAGHSLGGAMAAGFAKNHQDKLEGVVLLAAYPTGSLAESELSVLSLYGSEDRVLNMEKVEEGRDFMPVHYTELCIEGGNHALFGNYGEQEGDGAATITWEEQQKQTVEAIVEMVQP